MDQMWLNFLSLLAGLLMMISLSNQSPEYFLIKEFLSWDKAQSVCRTKHVDLATVQTNEDWAALKNLSVDQNFYSMAWTGLYQDTVNWFWSLNDEPLQYQNWAPSMPLNLGLKKECAAINTAGFWINHFCGDNRFFLCIDEQPNATQRVVLERTYITWLEAQKYCRTFYTDLMVIRNQTENDLILGIFNDQMYNIWIGLYRGKWNWSSRENLTDATRLHTQKMTGPQENCVLANYLGAVDDYTCTIRKKRQVVRVQVKASKTTSDATLTALISHKLQHFLNASDVSLTWRKQPGGKIFQKNKTKPRV
ncbi:hypothetical protein DNTS_015063 [Danionella cerebrum]|uniref:C-type lectin domain-containing protein n=1 Tax=Danionella cerebrum TaxID=2873325 RepID=A0A553Q078_9TELE|nr:hypothetical protein DNTS_015063 [Danionella translucida]